jgi:tetratricopeptide (TPR) repeat protein
MNLIKLLKGYHLKNYKNSALITITLLLVPLFLMGEDPGFHNRQGVQFGERKNYDRAIQEFNSSINIYDRESARVYYNRGWAYENTGDSASAIVNYEEALRRNPSLIIAGEKLGFTYYKTGDFINSVRVGEHVMNLDPANKEVPRWLPDAYMKKLQQEKELAEAQKKAEDEKKKLDEKNRQEEDERKAREGRILLATLDFTLKSGYYFAGSKDGISYVSSPGMFVDIPYAVKLKFTPIKAWEFNLEAGNPDLGALTPPSINVHSEKFDARYNLGSYMLGVGLMFNHYEGDLAYGSNELWDFKAGFIFGFTKDMLEMAFEFYPRLIPYDGSSSTGRTYDTDCLLISYKYTISPELKFYSMMNFRDYYIFNHTAKNSSYWGVYEIGIGMTLGTIDKNTNKTAFVFSVEFIERFYLENIDNDDPYTSLPNGQGLFGMDKSKWLKGAPFSGFKAFGHVLGVKVEEKVKDSAFLYQKIIIEIGDLDEDHHEFCLQLGAGMIL